MKKGNEAHNFEICGSGKTLQSSFIVLTAALLVTVVPTVVPVVAHCGEGDAEAIRALKLMKGAMRHCCKHTHTHTYKT